MKNNINLRKDIEKSQNGFKGQVVPFTKWIPSLALISLITFILMAFLIFYLNLISFEIKTWQLMVLILASASLAAPAGAYVVLRRMNVLYEKILQELKIRRKTEKELRIAKSSLESRVEERTRELKISNEQLEKELQYRIKTQEELNKSLNEKEMLVKEIHHRVKNNLQVISSLLSLQSREIKNENDLEIFRECQNRARSMAMIHERLYQSHNLRKIDFKEYLETLCQELFESYKVTNRDLKIDIDVDGLELDVNQAIPCGLIVNELISNSLKYAFPDSYFEQIRLEEFRKQNINSNSGPKTDFKEIYPAIKVKTRKFPDNFICLKVSDNGIGMPESFIFDDKSYSDTLGIKLIKTLTSQLNGTISLDRSHGTSFKIKFKEKTAFN